MARRLMSLGQLREFPVNLDIAKTPDGLFTATLTLPLTVFVGLGDPVPASSVQPQLPAVRIEWQMFHAGFAGRLDHGRLTGTLRLGNTAVPVTFARGVS